MLPLLLGGLVLGGCGGDDDEIPAEDRGRRLTQGWVRSFAWAGNRAVAVAADDQPVRVADVSTGSEVALDGVATRFLRAPGAGDEVWYASGAAVLRTAADGSTEPDTVGPRPGPGPGETVWSFAVSGDEGIVVVGMDVLSGPNSQGLPPVRVDVATGDTMALGTEWLRPVAVSPGGTRLLAFARATDPDRHVWEWVVVDLGTGTVGKSGVPLPLGADPWQAEVVEARWRWEGEDPVVAYLDGTTLRELDLGSGPSTTLGTLANAPTGEQFASGDGGRFTYWSGGCVRESRSWIFAPTICETFVYRVMVWDAASGERVAATFVTPSGVPAYAPRFSPDGAYIVYVWREGGSGALYSNPTP